VFAGTGGTATFIDGSSDNLSNYGAFQGCPPAGTVDIGGAVCGDVTMLFSLAPGTYTVLLTDGAYIPNAVFETNGMLGDGFTDLTGDAFQTCNGTDCITPNANWALDITTPNATVSAPEPAGLWVSGAGLILLAAASRQRLAGLQNNQRNKTQTEDRMKRFLRPCWARNSTGYILYPQAPLPSGRGSDRSRARQQAVLRYVSELLK